MKLFIVAKREYLKMVKSKAFWFSALFLPIFMVIVIAVESYSNNTLTTKLKNEAGKSQTILVMDETGLVNRNTPLTAQGLSFTDNFDLGVSEVKSKIANVFIFYSKDLLSTDQIKIYSQDTGILSSNIYNDLATNLIKQSILESLKDPQKIALYTANLQIQTTLYKDGVISPSGYERYVIPIASVAIYFIFTSFATAYLLMSVSEEKENRMIEIVLSSIKPGDLIRGKILGQVSAILTQLLILATLLVVTLTIASKAVTLPFDLRSIPIDPGQLFISLIYLFCGFLILANTMVGVGAAMPTYREASSFSSIFIILSIFPIYFAPVILSDPNGTVSYITSYFPFTAPMILMLRNALNVISPLEVVISIVVLIIYVYLTGVIAYKLFEFGAMEYTQKISFKSFLAKLFSRN